MTAAPTPQMLELGSGSPKHIVEAAIEVGEVGAVEHGPHVGDKEQEAEDVPALPIL